MSTSKPAKSAPLVTTSAVRKTASTRKPARRSRLLRPVGAGETSNCTISLLELDCDPADLAELFTDDLYYLLETRGYFWGYFD